MSTAYTRIHTVLKRLLQQKQLAGRLFLMGLRGVTLVSKFALTLFMVRLMSLSDLGLYGLVVGAASLVPAVLGLGLNGHTFRYIVDLPLPQALPVMTTRLAFTAGIHLAVLPLVLLANAVLGGPLGVGMVLLMACIVAAEHLAADAHGQLVSRHHTVMANVLLFIRGGAWPLAFMGAAWVFPALRNMESLLAFWLAGLAASGAIILWMLFSRNRVRAVGLNLPWLRGCFQTIGPFYLFDVGAAGSQYVDRFIITSFLGLEATGIYTFFWSIANAVSSLVWYGVTQPYNPRLIGAAKKKDQTLFIHTAKVMQRDILLWALGLSGVLCGSMPFLLPYLHRPELPTHLWAFWGIMLATVLRLMADGLHGIIYAKHRDVAMAAISMAGVTASAVFTGALTPVLGLAGTVLAALATGLILLYLRIRVTDPLLSPLSKA